MYACGKICFGHLYEFVLYYIRNHFWVFEGCHLKHTFYSGWNWMFQQDTRPWHKYYYTIIIIILYCWRLCKFNGCPKNLFHHSVHIPDDGRSSRCTVAFCPPAVHTILNIRDVISNTGHQSASTYQTDFLPNQLYNSSVKNSSVLTLFTRRMDIKYSGCRIGVKTFAPSVELNWWNIYGPTARGSCRGSYTSVDGVSWEVKPYFVPWQETTSVGRLYLRHRKTDKSCWASVMSCDEGPLKGHSEANVVLLLERLFFILNKVFLCHLTPDSCASDPWHQLPASGG